MLSRKTHLLEKVIDAIEGAMPEGSPHGSVSLQTATGITGPWQVAGRNRTFFSERVQMDTYYVRDWSIWLDLIILVRTLKTVVLSQGAY